MNGHRRMRWGSLLAVGSVVLPLSLAACGGRGGAQPEKTAAPGPPTIDVVRVVAQPLNVTLSLPGELNPFQTVAIYPRVTGFVKTIRVDRGSRVRAGELIAVLDAPELTAQRSEAQSKLQSAEAQLAAVRSKADADASTYDKLKAASATPGVVAGNDLVLAQKAVEADQGQVAAAQQNIEAARQALKIGERHGRLPEGHRAVRRHRDGTKRASGALVGPASGPGASTPMVRLVENDRLRLVVPVLGGAYLGERHGRDRDAVLGGGVSRAIFSWSVWRASRERLT